MIEDARSALALVNEGLVFVREIDVAAVRARLASDPLEVFAMARRVEAFLHAGDDGPHARARLALALRTPSSATPRCQVPSAKPAPAPRPKPEAVAVAVPPMHAAAPAPAPPTAAEKAARRRAAFEALARQFPDPRLRPLFDLALSAGTCPRILAADLRAERDRLSREDQLVEESHALAHPGFARPDSPDPIERRAASFFPERTGALGSR